MTDNDNLYIFTFGCGQEHEGKYVKIRGTYLSAREKMVNKYDLHWGFQYSEDEWNNWLKNKPFYIPAETLLEVIE